MFVPVNLCTAIIIPLLNNNDSLSRVIHKTRDDGIPFCSLFDEVAIKLTKLTIWLPIGTAWDASQLGRPAEYTFAWMVVNNIIVFLCGTKSVAPNLLWHLNWKLYTTNSNNSCFKHIKPTFIGEPCSGGNYQCIPEMGHKLASDYPPHPLKVCRIHKDDVYIKEIFTFSIARRRRGGVRITSVTSSVSFGQVLPISNECLVFLTIRLVARRSSLDHNRYWLVDRLVCLQSI